MKALLLLLLVLLGPLRANELTFDVPLGGARETRGSRLRVFLDSFDVFSEAVRESAVKYRAGGVDQEVKLPPCRLECDTEGGTLRVIFVSELPDAELRAISRALIHQVTRKSVERAKESIDQWAVTFTALKKELEAEPVGPRFMILEELLLAISPRHVERTPPLPLRLRKTADNLPDTLP